MPPIDTGSFQNEGVFVQVHHAMDVFPKLNEYIARVYHFHLTWEQHLKTDPLLQKA